MNTKEILIAAKALIDTPEKWTQGMEASTFDGQEVDFYHPSASCFCSIGAIYKAVGHVSADVSSAVVQLGLNGMKAVVSEFNDTHTHAEVMEAFDKAIAGCDA